MTENEELENLYRNYNELEHENQEKLLLVGKKMLGIKKLVTTDDVFGRQEGQIEV
jgi:hypothetical protein